MEGGGPWARIGGDRREPEREEEPGGGPAGGGLGRRRGSKSGKLLSQTVSEKAPDCSSQPSPCSISVQAAANI